MDRLIFTANMAMSEYRLDRQNMTHELANVSTPGFKKAFQVANRPIRTEGDGFDTRYLPRAITSPLIDLSPGPRMLTGRPLDIALDNLTLLPVQADNGEIAWTRRGDLHLDPEGFVRTGEGYLVLDPSFKPVQLPQGSVIYEIAGDGTISITDPTAPENGFQQVAALGIRDATGVDIARREDGLFKPISSTEDRQDFIPGSGVPSLTPGSLEGSNVSTVQTLVKFIDHMRSFEMQTKIIREMKDNDTSGESMLRLS
jgi:flagellar basal-body rod protein FlgF